MFETHAPGVFVVRYNRDAEMEPERQGPLLDAIRATARLGHVGIVFEVGPDVHWVDVAVPTFWLRATADDSLRIRAMAIVSGSTAVGIATAGFAAACAIRGTGLEARSFRSRPQALAWVCEKLAAPAAAPAAG